MKYLVSVLMCVVFMSCGLDETGGREVYSKNARHSNPSEKEIVIVDKYYDENGDEITNTEIIKELDSKG